MVTGRIGTIVWRGGMLGAGIVCRELVSAGKARDPGLAVRRRRMVGGGGVGRDHRREGRGHLEAGGGQGIEGVGHGMDSC